MNSMIGFAFTSFIMAEAYIATKGMYSYAESCVCLIPIFTVFGPVAISL